MDMLVGCNCNSCFLGVQKLADTTVGIPGYEWVRKKNRPSLAWKHRCFWQIELHPDLPMGPMFGDHTTISCFYPHASDIYWCMLLASDIYSSHRFRAGHCKDNIIVVMVIIRMARASLPMRKSLNMGGGIGSSWAQLSRREFQIQKTTLRLWR